MLATRAAIPATPRVGPLVAYLRLEVRRTLRNRRYLVLTILFPVILYVLYTAVLPVDAAGTKDGLTWPVFFLVSMATYGAMGAAMGQAAPIALERRSGWVQQLRVTPLPGPAYIIAKVASALVLTVPALVLVIAAGTLANSVELAPASAAALLVSIPLGALPFALLAVVLGYVLDAESAQGGMVLAYFLMAILGGLFAPLDAFPAALATIGAMLPASHLAALGRSLAAGVTPSVADVAVLAAWSVALGAIAAWRYQGDERTSRG